MKVEDLIQAAKAYEEIAEGIKSGNIEIQDFREQLDLTVPAMKEAIVMARKLLNDEDIEGISEIQKIAIKAQLQQEMIEFNYKEHKRNVVTLLEMVEALDKDIKNDLFLPYIENLLNIVLPLLDETHSDAAKAVRKGLKKFNKNRIIEEVA